MMRSEEEKYVQRDFLALQACLNDEAELAMVLTMGKNDEGVPGRLRMSLHHEKGLDHAAADHLMRHMIKAFEAWPEVYGDHLADRTASNILKRMQDKPFKGKKGKGRSTVEARIGEASHGAKPNQTN